MQKIKELKRCKHIGDTVYIVAEDGVVYEIVNLGSCIGQYSRQEWLDDEPICLFNKEGQREIMRTLEMVSNEDFFSVDIE